MLPPTLKGKHTGVSRGDGLTHIERRNATPENAMTPEQFAELKEYLAPVIELAKMQIAYFNEEMKRRSEFEASRVEADDKAA